MKPGWKTRKGKGSRNYLARGLLQRVLHSAFNLLRVPPCCSPALLGSPLLPPALGGLFHSWGGCSQFIPPSSLLSMGFAGPLPLPACLEHPWSPWCLLSSCFSPSLLGIDGQTLTCLGAANMPFSANCLLQGGGITSLGNGCEATWGVSMGMAVALESQNRTVSAALEFIQVKHKSGAASHCLPCIAWSGWMWLTYSPSI